MKNIKKFTRKYLIGFTLGLISAGIVVVSAETYFPSNQTTYDNSASGLSSTNVQGAIDELYNTCFPPKSVGDQILEQVEIEKDPYECRYFFKGANPNNYITFNNEEAGWRIMSIECDGTIKIVRDNSIEILPWDSLRGNDWTSASLNTYLNSTYYNSLTSAAQSQIVSHDFGIGGMSDGSREDMSSQVSNENSTKWNGKIALPVMSEYIRINSNTTQCGTYYLSNYNYNTCQSTNWMFNREYFWTLTKVNNTNNKIFVITATYDIRNNEQVYVNNSNVYPTLYLSSNLQITGGDGSSSNPYTIK